MKSKSQPDGLEISELRHAGTGVGRVPVGAAQESLAAMEWHHRVRKGRSCVTLVILLLVLATAAAGETPLPEVAPVVQSVMPAGAQRGTSVEVEIRGRNLNDATEIGFAREDIQAEILSSEFYQILARVKVGKGVPLGIHDYRLRTPRGSYVGVFHVGSLPQQAESEPNDDLGDAQKVAIPSFVDGFLEAYAYDLFRFQAEAGQTLIVDLMAARAASSLDGSLAILDERGRELDYNDDYYMSKDPHLTFTAKQGGQYFVRVGTSRVFAFADPLEGSYRLMIGQVPLMRKVMPVGARRGHTAEFELSGVNLADVRKVVLGDSLVEGEVLEASHDRLRFRMSVPGHLTPGRYFLHALADSVESPLPLPIVISEVDEQLSSSARVRDDPQQIELPIGISGILESRKAADFLAFDAEVGQRLAFRVDSMQLGYLLDAALFIYDLDGNRLAYQDEPAPNNAKEMPNLDPYLVHEFDRAGRYIVMIRDSAVRGHPDYVYRLVIETVEPDFELMALTPSPTLFRGKTNNLVVRVKRLGGWDAPVDVWIENLPPGVQAEKGVAEPKNTPYKGTCAEDMWMDGTNVELHLKVAEEAPGGFHPIRVRARGEFGGKVVEREAEILFRWGSVGKIYGPTTDQELLAAVTDLPPVILETPENFSVAPGKTGRLKVIATRFAGPDGAIALTPHSLPSGVTIENGTIPPGTPLADLLIKVSETAAPGKYPLILRAGGTSSAPIELTIAGAEKN